METVLGWWAIVVAVYAGIGLLFGWADLAIHWREHNDPDRITPTDFALGSLFYAAFWPLMLLGAILDD